MTMPRPAPRALRLQIDAVHCVHRILRPLLLQNYRALPGKGPRVPGGGGVEAIVR